MVEVTLWLFKFPLRTNLGRVGITPAFPLRIIPGSASRVEARAQWQGVRLSVRV